MKHFYLKTIFAWLMMTMLFPLAIHAEEGYYYIGSQNNWDPGNKTYQFTKLSDGKTWTLTMNAHSSDEFKIAPLSVESWDDWDKMLVPEGSSGLSGNMSYGGANFSVTSSNMTSYTINIVPSEMTYEITIMEDYKDGDIFTALTEEGVEMTFKVISAKDKICQAGTFKVVNYHYVSNTVPLDTKGKITIPSIVNDFIVTKIGEYAFSTCSDINTIIIPNTVTDIGEAAFLSCHSLEFISIPNGTISIGESAFSGCKGLTSVTIPYTVSFIGEYAFSCCDNLSVVILESNSIVSKDYTLEGLKLKDLFDTKIKEYIIGDQVENIGDYAFYGCNNLSSITIGSSVRNIGNRTFDNCDNLISVTLNSNSIVSKNYTQVSNLMHIFGKQVKSYIIGDQVESIGDYAFYYYINPYYNSYLTSVTIGRNVSTIGKDVFMNCSRLTSVTLESNALVSKNYTTNSNLNHIFGTHISEYILGKELKSIGDYAFYNCSALTSITIPNNVTTIGNSAFRNCSNLNAIIIPNSVTSIGKYALHGTSWYDNQSEGLVYAGNVAYVYKGIMPTSTPITLKNETVGIADNAFYGCDGLISIIVPDKVISIGNNAFTGCNSLTSVTLNSNAIISKSYSSDSNLKNMFGEQVEDYTLGDEIKSIGDYAFYGCGNLIKLTIPSSMTSIGKDAFLGCNGLQKVVVSDIAAWSHVSLKNIESNPLYYAHHVFSDENTEITELVIPANVETIGEYVFAGCNSLSSVIIPSSVTNLTENAFYGCNSFYTVTLKSDAVVSKDYTSSIGFKDVFGKQVKKYVLGESVTGIGNYAFYNCTELVSINIPNHVTHIGTAAFAECSGLTSVNIPNSVIDLASDAFSGCSALASVTLDNDAIVSKSFNSSSNLKNYFGPQVKEYILGENISSIGDYAFYDCNELTKINIPSNVTNIGNRTFAGCSSIVQINIPINLKAIGNDAFENCNSLVKVIVPNLAAWCGITFANNGAYDNSNPLSIAHHLYNEDGTEITDLIIPEGVETINSYAFYGGSNFTSVTIPSSLKTINDYSFYGCDNLSKVIVPDLTSWCNINFGSNYNSNPLSISGHLYSDNEHEILDLVIPYGVANINDGAFYGGKFSSLALPTSLKTIGNYAFSLCPNITSVVIPNGVTTIGMGAFGLCDKLATVVIPNSVSSIGKSAFANCLSLYSVTSLINIPFNLDESAFQYLGSGYDKNIIYMAATLYVPRGRNAMYGNVQGWKNFTNIMETDTKYSLTYMLDGEVYKNYEIQATEVITPEPDPYREGYEFSGWSAIPSVMPAHDVVVTGSFTPSTGINTTSLDESTVECYYSIDGQRINTPQRGVNIIKMKDGSIKKIMVK